MSYSVLDLKNDTVGEMHGTTSNQVQNFDGVINRAARQLLLDVDPQETKRTVEFVAPIFNSVYDYPIASDVKGNKVIDIFPQVQRLPLDIWGQQYQQAFDVAKQNIYSAANMFTINFNTSLKTMRINAPYLNTPTIISQIDNITDNGTWSLVVGNSSNLTVNNTNFVQGSGSLQFDTTTGFNGIQNDTLTPVDLSAVVNQSSFFVWVYVPTGSALSSVDIQVGSSNNDFYYLTVTQNQQGVAFVNGWNLCQFDWANAPFVGTPDPSSIIHAVVTFTTTANMVGCKVNGFNSILGTILNYSYYSKFLFRNASTGAYQETVLDDSDLINLDTESYNLLTYQVLYLVAQQQQGQDAPSDGGFAKQAYDAGLIRYKSMYKSELQKPQSVYYSQPMTGYNRIPGRGFGNN